MRTMAFNYVLVRNGADCGLLSPAKDSTPTIRMDDTGEIKMSFSGDFLPTVFGFDGKPTNLEINWLADEIRPEMVIDGEVSTLGIYLPATVESQFGDDGTTLLYYSIEAYDRCWRVQTSIYTSILLGQGTNYLTAVEAFLTASGVALVSATPTAETLAEDRADWNIGTDALTVVNQLLSEINYTQLWFDSSGMAILEPVATPSAANIDHTISENDVKSLLRAGMRKTTDIYDAPNVFIVACSNADKSATMTATSENTNPQSPLSIPSRGRRITTIVNVDNIADQTELQAYADRLRNESMITAETIEVTTGLLPGFGVGDVTALDYGDSFAVCKERAWSMSLEPGGEMQHTLEKVVINLA